MLAKSRSDAPLVASTTRTTAAARLRQAVRGGAPSLVEQKRLKIVEDVTFGAGVVVKGSVTVKKPSVLDDGTVLEG